MKKQVTTKDGYKLEVVKVYQENEKFYGKVLVIQDGCKTGSRFDVNYFNSIVEDKDKV